MKNFRKSLRQCLRKFETRVKHFTNRYLQKVGLLCFFLAFCASFPSFSSAPAKKYPIIITQEQRVEILEDRIAELERENSTIRSLEIEVAQARTEVTLTNKSNRALRTTVILESTIWIAVLIFLACV